MKSASPIAFVLKSRASTPFPKNLRDPVDAETATISFEDLFLASSQGASRLTFGISSRP